MNSSTFWWSMVNLWISILYWPYGWLNGCSGIICLVFSIIFLTLPLLNLCLVVVYYILSSVHLFEQPFDVRCHWRDISTHFLFLFFHFLFFFVYLYCLCFALFINCCCCIMICPPLIVFLEKPVSDYVNIPFNYGGYLRVGKTRDDH